MAFSRAHTTANEVSKLLLGKGTYTWYSTSKTISISL